MQAQTGLPNAKAVVGQAIDWILMVEADGSFGRLAQVSLNNDGEFELK